MLNVTLRRATPDDAAVIAAMHLACWHDAYSGTGLATVERLVAEGALVVTCARDGVRLLQATTHLSDERILAVQCDVRERSAVDAMIAATLQRFGRLDGLVNNVGQGRSGRLHELADADWHDEVAGKVFGVLNPTRRQRPAHAAR